MSPTDIPPVTTPHSAQIIGSNYPTTSETGTVASVITLFEQSAASVGTGNTAEVMHALIEANATGQTPSELLAGFTEDQRAAYDRALRQLNMGQGASVMAQDILNTKVQLNGVATSFEAAVEELIASYAGSGGPSSPKNQAEFQQKYQELLDQAKQAADTLGSNHKATQDSLVAGVQKGAAPEIPSTMAPTSSSAPTVPGMPEGALGSMLQSVGGLMSKPPNLPMPNLGQSIQPLAQSAQSAIGELMKKLPGGSGVPITEDALARLAKTSGVGEQGSSLSAARGAGSSGSEASGGAGSGLPRTSLAGAGSPDNARASGTVTAADESADADLEDAAPVETTASTPTEPAVTAAPTADAAPATTLSSGDAGTAGDSLSAPRTHTSSGDSALGGSSLSSASGPAAAAGAGAGAGAAAGGGAAMGPMMPMGAMGGAGAAGAASAPGTSTRAGGSAAGGDGKPVRFQPPGRDAPAELLDFGADLKGLEHATDMQLVAASIAAALVRMHDRAGLSTEVAVGVSASTAVFVTSDGLGFLPPGMRAAGHLIPLVTRVPDAFASRWLGCDQPWRPLLEAAGVGLVGPFDAVVATDPAAESQGVLTLGPAEIGAVNIAAGSQDRWEFDSVDPEDVRGLLELLASSWGRPVQSPEDLHRIVVTSRWAGESGPGGYLACWARYLLSCAVADLVAGRVDDARYALRSALRVPEPALEPWSPPAQAVWSPPVREVSK
ncbi:hypothetical protein [Mycolicibacterium sp.]|uniref:hypothetical protein n=1 Tax=Mycolicibacterium sp. TaxID=2320850 RepID=UPI00355F14E2